MVRFFLMLFFTLSFLTNCFSQTMVVKSPSWAIHDQEMAMEQRAVWAEGGAQAVEQLAINNERLKLVKDATKRLKEINRKIANVRYLEDAISTTTKATMRMGAFMKNIEADNLFEPEEYRAIFSHCTMILSSAQMTIDALTIVITDNFAEMNDFERMTIIRESLQQLKDDVAVLNSFMNEVNYVNNQRMQIRTLKYMQWALRSDWERGSDDN